MVQLRSVLVLLAVVVAVSSLQFNRREILRRRHHHHHTTARPIPPSTVTGGWTGPQWGTTRGGWAARSQRMLEMLKLRNENASLKKELAQLKGI